jgi:DNA-binding CsgD family transcriptional regulator
MAALTDLSERECEILRLVATGASNKEIAQRLVISPNTVKVHLRNIFAKIEVVSRTEATLYAIQHGLVEAARPPAVPEPTPTATEPASPTPALTHRLPPRWLRAARLFGLLGAVLLALLAGRVLIERSSQAAAPASQPARVRWQARPELPGARAGMAAVAYENGLYLIGGESGDGLTASVLYYSPGQNSYAVRAEKPQRVKLAQAALLGERIYVPGGQTADGSAIDILEIYDPRQDTWTTGTPMPLPLYGYALAALEGRMVLFGGFDGTDYSAAVFSYDPELDVWSVGTALPEAAAYSAAVAAGAGKILLAGGLNDSGAQDAVFLYYPQRDANGEPPWEARAPLPEARYGMAMAGLANAVYLVGGSSSTLGEVGLPPLQYALQADAWQQFEIPPQPAGLFPALLTYETHLHLLGGASDGPLSSHQAYQAIYTLWVPVIQ